MNYFKNIVGQDLALKILESSIDKKHISPAYLFSGPEGIGRKKTAKLFASAILDKNEVKENTQRKIEHNNHIDLFWVEPSYIIQGKNISQGRVKLENINMKSPPQIRLKQIKEIIEFLGTRPLESEKSIIIIEDCEHMNEAASNALLKTLEEPNHATFILLTERPEKLLETIRSRCQIVPFKRLNNDQLNIIINKIDNIKSHQDITNKKIKELISFSNGSPGKYLTNLESWLNIPENLRKKLSFQLNDQIQALTLAKEITEELNIEQQLWLINFQQNSIWEINKNSKIVIRLEKLRNQLLKYVQPRLAWEIALIEINFID